MSMSKFQHFKINFYHLYKKIGSEQYKVRIKVWKNYVNKRFENKPTFGE